MLDKAGFVTFVPVKKMDRAVKFYTEGLGGKVKSRGEGEMKDSFASVKIGRHEFWLITPSAVEKRELSYSAFVVDDISVAVSELRSRGVKFNRPEKSSPKTKIEGAIAREPWGAEAFFKDSEGNLLMLWQGEM